MQPRSCCASNLKLSGVRADAEALGGMKDAFGTVEPSARESAANLLVEIEEIARGCRAGETEAAPRPRRCLKEGHGEIDVTNPPTSGQPRTTNRVAPGARARQRGWRGLAALRPREGTARFR